MPGNFKSNAQRHPLCLLVVGFSVFLFFFLAGSSLAKDQDTDQVKKDYLVSGLNQKGILYFQERKWKQALFNFEKSYEINPTNDAIRQNLLVTYLEVMLEEAQGKKWERVVELQKKARRLVSLPNDEKLYGTGMIRLFQMLPKSLPVSQWQTITDSAVQGAFSDELKKHFSVAFHNLAVEAMRQKAVMAAKTLCLDSLALYPHFETYSLLGELYYQIQELSQAKTAWEYALRMKSDKSIRKKLKRLKQEMLLEENLEEFTTEHFIVRWNRAEWERSGPPLQEVVEKAYDELSHDFRVELKNKAVILLYKPEKYYSLSQSLHWSGGFYDGKVRLPYGPGFFERTYQKVIWHELSHAFIFEVTRGNCPVWLNEGLAQVEENKIEPISLTVFLAARATGALFSLSEMNERPDKLKDSLEIGIYYQEAFVLTQYLLEHYGWDQMNLLLTKLGHGISFQQAFFEMTRKDFVKFEIEWLASFKSKD